MRCRSAVLLLLASVSLGAQDGPPLTEGELIAAVIDGHPAAAALLEERDLAAAEELRASLLPNPAFEAAVERPAGDAQETTATLTWPLPLDGRRALRREAAAKGLAAAEERLEAARLRLRLGLRAAYADWAFAWRRREILAVSLGRVSELAQRADARARSGEIAGLAAHRFALEEAQARADLARAEAELAAARAAVVSRYPGLAEGARPAAFTLPPLPAPTDLAGRADVAARERDVERAEAERKLSLRFLEAPVLGLGWKRVEQGANARSGPVAVVGWSLPLLDRRQADRREAEARLAAARAELELARARAQAEQAGTRVAFERLRSAAEQASRSAADTERMLAGAVAAYQLGESGLTDLLDTLRAALGLQVAVLDVQRAALAAHRDLEAALGRPLPLDGGMP